MTWLADRFNELCTHEQLLAECPERLCAAVRQSLAAEAAVGADNSAEAWQEDMLDDPSMDGMGEELRRHYGD